MRARSVSGIAMRVQFSAATVPGCCGVTWPNDIEFNGERKRVRCNEGLGARPNSHCHERFGQFGRTSMWALVLMIGTFPTRTKRCHWSTGAVGDMKASNWPCRSLGPAGRRANAIFPGVTTRTGTWRISPVAGLVTVAVHLYSVGETLSGSISIQTAHPPISGTGVIGGAADRQARPRMGKSKTRRMPPVLWRKCIRRPSIAGS